MKCGATSCLLRSHSPAYGDIGLVLIYGYAKRSMSSSSLPAYICDWNMAYAGCVNKQQLATVDSVFVALHLVSASCYGLALLRKFRTKTAGGKTKSFTSMDSVGVMCIVLNIVRSAFRLSTRQLAFYDDTASPWSLLAKYASLWTHCSIRASIYLEHFFSLLGALALKNVLLSCVGAADAGDLYPPINVNGKKVNPADFLSKLRVFVSKNRCS